MPTTRHWDIFCTVIDNFGDIGVSWRLARQLAREHGKQVRLWVDDLDSFGRIEPELDPALARQQIGTVEVCHWSADWPAGIVPGEVVIEAFGCTLPDAFMQAMTVTRPVWINLEYLSAEAWVDDCHGMVSPHPRLGLLRYFYFPGYGPGAGGLIEEAGLEAQVRAWQADEADQRQWLDRLGVAPAPADALRLSLFAYDNPALPALLAGLRTHSGPVHCLVPEGKILPALSRALGGIPLERGQHWQSGGLSISVLPFLRQDDYDRLLWSCHINMVRGEDSFVRAQWARRPFLWHIYPQDDNAHMAKLAAFLDRHAAGLPPDTARHLRTTALGWNNGQLTAGDWQAFCAQRDTLARHAWQWAAEVAQSGDLAHRLVHFAENRIQ